MSRAVLCLGRVGELLMRDAYAMLRARFDAESVPYKRLSLLVRIAAASREQAAGVHQINSAMTQLGQATQQNATAFEELAATPEEMSGQAENLQQLVEFFRVSQQQRKEQSASERKARKGAGSSSQEASKPRELSQGKGMHPPPPPLPPGAYEQGEYVRY